MSARTEMPVGDRCRTTATGAGKSAGRAPTKADSASTPPAEAPTTTMARGRLSSVGALAGPTAARRSVTRPPAARRALGDFVPVPQGASALLPVLQQAPDPHRGLLAAAPLRRRNERLPPHVVSVAQWRSRSRAVRASRLRSLASATQRKETTRPITPTTTRIRPTVWMSIQSTSTVMAQRMIAPTAMRKMDVPMPTRPPGLPRPRAIHANRQAPLLVDGQVALAAQQREQIVPGHLAPPAREDPDVGLRVSAARGGHDAVQLRPRGEHLVGQALVERPAAQHRLGERDDGAVVGLEP